MGRKSRPQNPKPSKVLPAPQVTKSEPVPAQSLPGIASAPEVPLYTCKLSVFADKHTITEFAPGTANVMASKLFRRQMLQVWPNDAKLPKLVTWITSAYDSKVVKAWGRKWRDRAGAATLWTIYMSWLFRGHGLLGVLFDNIGLGSTWEPWTLLAITAGLLIYLSTRGVPGALVASLYMLFFPFVVAGVLFAKAFGTLSVINRITMTLGSLAYSGANWLLMVVACATIAKSSSDVAIYIAAFYLAIGTIYLVISNFYWVTRPLSTVFRALEWVDGQSQNRLGMLRLALDEYQSSLTKGIQQDIKRAQDQVVKLLDSAKSWVKIASLISGKLRKIVSPVVLFYLYATRFFGSIVLIVVVFASLDIGIAKFEPQSYGGAGIHNFSDAIYFSVSSFFTVGYGDIVPVSVMARWILVTQIGIAVLMLTLLVLSFSTLSAHTTASSAEQFEDRAKRFLEELAAALSQHFLLGSRPLDEEIEDLKKAPRARWR